MNHREITKKYSELLNKAEFATGRKEVVGLLKSPFLGSFFIDSFVSEIFVFLGFNFEFLGLLSANNVWYTKKTKHSKET